ncbi:S-layer homology domain-containing protein [Lysinibacillus sp. NPDC047702]|uniref:S-layer homology domain-containing protein n=1 Tax=unclassified Lysinibacillus TaxID=2636778 RepID=UPI003D062335
MKKNRLFIVAAATAVGVSTIITGTSTTVEAATTNFSDVQETNSHYAAIMDLAQRNIIHGFQDGTFKPNESVTFKQTAKIIAGILNLDASDEQEWVALQAAGLIDSTVNPNDPITRNDMAKVIAKSLGLTASGSVSIPFTDVTAEHQQAVTALFEYGITKGTSVTTFSGDKFVTRGQLASFIVRAEQILKRASTTGATVTVERIHNNQVTIEGREWPIGKNAQTILNDKNAAALANAQLDVIVVNGEIAEVLAIDLNVSGRQGANVVLDGGNSSVGNIVVHADFVELKNMTVTGDIRVLGRTTSIALNQLKVKGELLLEEAEASRTASLTKLAVINENAISVEMTRSEFVALIVKGRAFINSDSPLPVVTHLGNDLQIIAPSVSLLNWESPPEGSQLSGTANIGTVIIGAEYDFRLQQMQQQLEASQASLREQQQLQEQAKKAILTRISDLTTQTVGLQQQINDLTKVKRTPVQDNQLTLLRQKLQQIENELLSLRVQSNQPQPSNNPAGIPNLPGFIPSVEQTKQMEERIRQIQEASRKLQQQNEDYKNLIQTALQINGTLNIGNIIVPSPAVSTFTLGPNVRINNVMTDISREALLAMFANVRQGQIKTLTSAKGQQTPFSSTPSEATDSGSNSNSGSSSGGNNTGGGNTTTPVDMTTLKKMISNAKERHAALQNGDQAISENGYEIPQAQQWIPKKATDALQVAITEAEAMVTKAAQGPMVYQRVASLTNTNILLANTQTDINRMAEKLEKLMNVQPISGLKEKATIQRLLNSKEITSIPDIEELTVGRVYEAIEQMLRDEFELEQEPLTIEEQELIIAMLREFKLNIQIIDNQVTIPLNETIPYTDPVTGQTSELVPAISAQLTIVQPLPLVINEVSYVDAENIRLTFTSNIEIPEGEQFIFMINDSLTPLYGTVSSSTDNSVVIRIDGPVPLFATFVHIERESKPEYNLLKEPFTMENTNV